MNRTAPESLTAPELFSRVHALSPRTAVFDCDGTLWSGDAGSSFMHWSMGEQVGNAGTAAPAAALLAPEACARLRGSYAGYMAGAVSELAICGEMVQVYAGLPVSTLRQAAAKFFREHIAAHVFPEMRELVASLQERGVEIWAVSSTCRWVIEEGVRGFGIGGDHVLAAEVEEQDDRATDRLIQVPTDEGKVEALRRVGIAAPDAVFGNSVHDAAMLAIARGAFPINPSPALIERSAECGWPVYQPLLAR